MDWREELNQLVRLCSASSKNPASRRLPQEENEPLAGQVRCWLEKHRKELDAACDQTEIQKHCRKIREFLLIHDAASRGPVPVQDDRYYVVIDTNVFFHHEDILDHLEENCVFVLPAIVLAELRNRTHDKDARSRQARQILARIRRFPARRILHVDVSGIDVRRFLSPFSTETRNDHCDNRILAAAKRLLIEKKPATLLSDDTALRKRAIESGITAVSLREFFADTVFPAKNKR